MIVSSLASLTRVEGMFLVFPIAIILLANRHKLQTSNKTLRYKVRDLFSTIIKDKKLVLISLSPFFGLLLYMLYLFITTGDFLRFYHAQAIFHNGRSTDHIILLPQVYYRYIRIILTASHNFIYFVAVNEFITFNLLFFILLYDLWMLLKQKKDANKMNLLGLNIFSLANLILPTLTGTLTSLPRYALLSLSFFIRIAELKNTLLRYFLLTLFTIFHFILLSLFIQGFFCKLKR